ncbi:MAG TPA: diaminopimelate decarboxylase [Streptosporangiaceae bacterium]|nr:diaminopimelate decarboxylase [Streptosporangiaceae bacterium]
MIDDAPRTAPRDLLPLFPEYSSVGPDGELAIGGVGVRDLAERFGTPAYIVDEAGLRAQARRFKDGLAARHPNSGVSFASKSFPCLAAYQVAAAEGLSIDVAGAGELVMALAAGAAPEQLYLHGNAKTTAELTMAREAGVGTVVVDNFDDIDRLEQLVTPGPKQRVLIRIIPGVAPVTHESQSTGGDDSKFGLPLDQAREAIARIGKSQKLQLDGLHLHIGSQILDTEPFARAVEAVAVLGTFDVYDVGGGLGVRYTLEDQAPTVEEYLDTIAAAAHTHLPAGAKLLIEPGRSLVARSCVTLYRVTTLKRTGRTFVAVDGGMADNLDAALTGQGFEAAVATRVTEPPDEIVQLVGRQCESGDLLVDRLPLPAPRVGDLIAMPVTGAYTYTLANNYNGAVRPPIVFCRDGKAKIAAERETHEHVLALHHPLEKTP